jgi:uncharacterized protein (TIGR02145 family)
MKNLIRISGVILLIFLIHSCKKDKPTSPVLTTSGVTSISYTTATSGGNVTNEGGSPVISRGVCWNTSTNPTIDNSKTVESGRLGPFTSNITNLEQFTQYHVRAYAMNSAGVGYGNQETFTTSQVALASLTTTAITSITQTTAVSGGNITNDNGGSVYARGVCWNNATNPTTANNKTTDGKGIETFVSNLIGLQPGTIYYVRSYATNNAGTSYGEEKTFTTYKANAISDFEGYYYNIINIGTQVWMGENLKTTKYSDGTSIPLVNSENTWGALTTTSKAYSWYNDNINSKDIYGTLYTWAAAMNGTVSSSTDPSGVQGVCPTGWHLPSLAEWTELETFLGGSNIAGGKMKESGITHWDGPNTGATNESGFTGLPGGIRQEIGSCVNMGVHGVWWSSTEPELDYARTTTLTNWAESTFINTNPKKRGLSVRCVKD